MANNDETLTNIDVVIFLSKLSFQISEFRVHWLRPVVCATRRSKITKILKYVYGVVIATIMLDNCVGIQYGDPIKE